MPEIGTRKRRVEVPTSMKKHNSEKLLQLNVGIFDTRAQVCEIFLYSVLLEYKSKLLNY